jgi:hypothetical protein
MSKRMWIQYEHHNNKIYPSRRDHFLNDIRHVSAMGFGI